jgi:hypothetical protein
MTINNGTRDGAMTDSIDMDKRPPAPRATARKPKEPKLWLNPMGFTTERPKANDTLPPMDRGALMQNAHVIARRYRAAFPASSYAEALAYGLKAAWGQWRVARSIQSLAAQVAPPSERTAADMEATRAARWGSFYAGI